MLHQIANADPREHILVPGQQIILLPWFRVPRPDEDIQNLRAEGNQQALDRGPNRTSDVLAFRLLLAGGGYAERHAAFDSMPNHVVEAIWLDVEKEASAALILVEDRDLIAVHVAALRALQGTMWLLLLNHLKLSPPCSLTWLKVAFIRGPTSR